jgi:hypothetical protein
MIAVLPLLLASRGNDFAIVFLYCLVTSIFPVCLERVTSYGMPSKQTWYMNIPHQEASEYVAHILHE